MAWSGVPMWEKTASLHLRGEVALLVVRGFERKTKGRFVFKEQKRPPGPPKKNRHRLPCANEKTSESTPRGMEPLAPTIGFKRRTAVPTTMAET